MVISEYLTCSEIKGGSFKMTIKEKIEQIENDDNANDEHVLHQLLELAMAVTGRGDVSDDYTHFIEFPLGDIMLFSDPYYGNVQIDETDLDTKIIKKLITEIKKRLLQFDKKIETIREQAATEIFDKPLKIN